MFICFQITLYIAFIYINIYYKLQQSAFIYQDYNNNTLDH